jgi:hypothetical protein
MKRPKASMQKLIKNPQVRTGLMTLPGIGEFSINQPHPHHPYCPSAEEPRFVEFIKKDRIGFSTSLQHPGFISHEDQVENLDPTTSAFYPLTPEAIRAIDAVEYITDYLKKDEEIKMVGTSMCFFDKAKGLEEKRLEIPFDGN